MLVVLIKKIEEWMDDDHDSFLIAFFKFMAVFIPIIIGVVLLLALIASFFIGGGPCPEGTTPITEFSHYIYTNNGQIPIYETVGCAQ